MQNVLIQARNIDFTTMKRWIPDYTNRSDVSLLKGSGAQIEMSDTGFICYRIKRYGNNQDALLRVNGKLMTASCSSTNAIADTSGVLPVFAGDIVTPVYNGDTGDNYLYFIPGRWV